MLSLLALVKIVVPRFKAFFIFILKHILLNDNLIVPCSLPTDGPLVRSELIKPCVLPKTVSLPALSALIKPRLVIGLVEGVSREHWGMVLLYKGFSM
jgi:hypothetical protein